MPNPMRWNCQKDGCFNAKKRPKIEVFYPCFPGRINFGDVDGIVEINSKALMLEWKPAAMDLGTGQRLLYERLTSSGPITAFIVAGDAETMAVIAYQIYWRGKNCPWIHASLDDVKTRVKAWSDWARGVTYQRPAKTA